jgi:hypothetical protein
MTRYRVHDTRFVRARKGQHIGLAHGIRSLYLMTLFRSAPLTM